MIRSVTEDEVESNESHLLNIPFDLLGMLMKHCVGVEYLRFRATCKLCHSAAPLTRGRKKSGLTRLQNNYSLVSPWLMEVDEEEALFIFTDPLLGDKYFMYCLPEVIFQRRIYCSRFGWLLFEYYSDDNTLVFYNPFTNDIHELPPIRPDFWLVDSFSFSAPPTSPDCMVVGFLRNHHDWCVHVHFVSGEFLWHRLNLSLGGDDIHCYRFPTFFGRDLYALLEDKLHVFKDLGVDNYSWEQDVAKAPTSCSTSWTKHFLTRHDQHLLLVMVSEESAKVFKLDVSTKTWGEMDGLGRLMIYICDDTCLCTEAETPEMGNKIYFPELHSKNGRIVFYSLETCTYGTFNRKTVEETRTMVRYLDRAHTWIEPSWS
uniref:F-box protein At4g00893-like n=1 Tax=Erigeron canadensis TaxID=72917 RepID=UPI001CB9722D|nr:F-box protein At4g00893-like [Erigeron canadensis]